MKKVCLFFSLFISILSFSQNNLKFDRYTINDGLSQSNVTSIAQDINGFIWIGTQDGLNKFDGYDFTVYKSTSKENKLSGNNINQLFISSDNLIYIATSRGVDFYNPQTNTITNFEVNSKRLNDVNVKCIAEDKLGNLYFGTKDKGIYIYDKKSNKLINHSAIKLKNLGVNNVSTICILEDNEILIGGEKNGICKTKNFIESIKIKTKNFKEKIEFIKKINEIIFVGTNQFLYTYENDNLKSFNADIDSSFNNTSFKSIYKESKNKYWIGTNNKGLISLFKSKKNDVILTYNFDYYQSFSISSNKINCIYSDRSGVIWIGTNQGVSKIDLNKHGFQLISMSSSPQNGLLGLNVWSISEDPESKYYYVGTEKSVSRLNIKTNLFEHFYNNQDKTALSIYPENNEKIWVGTLEGLFLLKINPNNHQIYDFQKIKHSNNKFDEIIYDIEFADDEYIWVSTSNGISRIHKTTKKYKYFNDKNSGLGKGPFKKIYKYDKEKVFFSSGDGGLYYSFLTQYKSYDFKPVKFNDNLKEEIKTQITSISNINNDELWLGTYESGLINFNIKNGKILKYDETKGLPNNLVCGILRDSENNLWLSSNKGIAKFNTKNKTFFNYNVFDGLQSNEFNTGAYYMDKKGIMFFGGIKGLTYFLPSQIKSNNIIPQPIITELYVNQKRVKPNSEILDKYIPNVNSIELNYNQNDIEVKVSAQHYTNPKKNSYKYKLEGKNKSFIHNGTLNQITYTDLKPNSYVLKIFASNADGIWSEKPTILKIEIKPAFWNTWWFRSVLLSILLISSYFFIRKRNNKIKREQIKLEIEIAKRTREIRTQNKEIEKQKLQVEKQNSKIEEQKSLLQIEKEKSDNLLLKILPAETAEELKNYGTYRARNYKNVTVMFTDFVGFSKIAEKIAPNTLVNRLDVHFKKFDEIIEKNSLEKIKTIGDAYMCAGGMPKRNKINPVQAVLAGLQIQKYMLDNRIKKEKKGLDFWELRLGINTGEVVAGVIGLKRFAYDIWGTTVNQAQRMEMHGKVGKVNIGGPTYQIIKPYFVCKYRGRISTKNKGMMDMFFVDRIKPELSEDRYGTIPNEKFWKIVDLHNISEINYQKAESHILNVLKNKLSNKLYYHCLSHTIGVTKAVERIAISEGVTDEDLFLLKTATNFHDAGFIEKYDKNEPIGVRLAIEILPKYGYKKTQINKITELIYATTVPHKPKNELEEIICDADLDYLGRDDFHQIADCLRRELREYGKLNSDKLWDEIQLNFLTSHRYFTDTAINTRQQKKLKHIEEIKQRLKENNYVD